MITYDKAALNIYNMVNSEIDLFNRNLKTSDNVHQYIRGYLKATVDAGLCGEGYAAKILDNVSEILFK